jgi:L-alanine-DL-glutamate epimerase-like enolase superfamily enzyme
VKITRVEPLAVDAGWRPWLFVKIETDEGLTGYGECSDGNHPYGVTGSVRDFEKALVGRDPGRILSLDADVRRIARQAPGGVAARAAAGIDCALWDIKAKALGVPVCALLGGPTRDRIRLYWSHCGTSRARFGEIIGTPPIRSLADVAALGKEVVARGFTALKTNIVLPGDPAGLHMPGFFGNYAAEEPGAVDLNLTPALLRHVEAYVGTWRAAVGPDVEIALDLNSNFKTEGFVRLCRAVEQFDPMWVELDAADERALRQVKESTTAPICSGENLITARQYQPYFDLRAMDVAMVDVPWNGFTEAKKVVDLADLYDVNVAPHNYYSDLSSLMSAHLCAVSTNVRIQEIDVDDVPWKHDLVTEPLVVVDGHLTIPTGPGWGADLDEKECAKHPWPA